MPDDKPKPPAAGADKAPAPDAEGIKSDWAKIGQHPKGAGPDPTIRLQHGPDKIQKK